MKAISYMGTGEAAFLLWLPTLLVTFGEFVVFHFILQGHVALELWMPATASFIPLYCATFERLVLRRRRRISFGARVQKLQDGTLVECGPIGTSFVVPAAAGPVAALAPPSVMNEPASMAIRFRFGPSLLARLVLGATFSAFGVLFTYHEWFDRLFDQWYRQRFSLEYRPWYDEVYPLWALSLSSVLQGLSYGNLIIHPWGITVGGRQVAWDKVQRVSSKGAWLTIGVHGQKPIRLRLLPVSGHRRAADVAEELVLRGQLGFARTLRLGLQAEAVPSATPHEAPTQNIEPEADAAELDEAPKAHLEG